MAYECCLCRGTPFYICGKTYYCKLHKLEAIEATKRDNDRRSHGNGYQEFRGSGH